VHDTHLASAGVASSAYRQLSLEHFDGESAENRFFESHDFRPMADAEFDFARKFLLVLNRIFEPSDLLGE
jgi:hypothetical protein